MGYTAVLDSAPGREAQAVMPENDEAKPVFLNGNWYIPAALMISFFLLFLANSAGSSGEPDIPVPSRATAGDDCYGRGETKK